MGYRFHWIIPDQLYAVIFEGEMTLDILQHVDADTVALLRQHPSTAQLHTILDTRNLTKFPMNVKLLTDPKVSSYRHEPNLGWIILVSENSLVRFLGTVVNGLSISRFAVVHTLDDAFELLKERVTHLNWDATDAYVLSNH